MQRLQQRAKSVIIVDCSIRSLVPALHDVHVTLSYQSEDPVDQSEDLVDQSEDLVDQSETLR